MNAEILSRLSAVTAEEQAILDGRIHIDRSLYMDGQRDIITGSKLLEAGRLIAVRPHTRFVHFPAHTHDYVEIVYMCQGRTIHTVNGSRLVLETGELLMLGQRAVQEIEPAGAGDIAVNLIVRPDFFSGILRYMEDEQSPLRRFVQDCLTGGSDISWLHFHCAGLVPVQDLMESLLWTLIHDTANKRGIHQLTMGLLFAHLLENTDTLTLSTRDQQTVMEILRYVEEHYQDGSLTEIAGRTHCELTALCRLIQRETGRTFTQLMQEKRLSQAAWLLKNTACTVDEISSLVGYENTSYFHRLFHTRFGVTPRLYRQGRGAG